MLYTSKQITILPTLQNISDTVQKVDRQFKAWKVKSSNCIESIMTLEELLVQIRKTFGEEKRVGIRMVKSYQNIYVRISYRGGDVTSATDYTSINNLELDENIDPETEDAVRNIFLRATSKRVISKTSKNITTINILAENKDNAMLYNTVFAIFVAIIVGLTLRNSLPEDTVQAIATNAFTPLYTIFIRCIQIIMAPLVFFSMTYSMLGFSDVKTLGRLGGKVVGTYVVTTLMALLMAIGIDAIIDPSSMGGIALPADSLSASSTATGIENFSLLNSLINIVPDNFLGAFVRTDMLQIIFLAILTGTAAAQISKYSKRLKECIEMLDSLFEAITANIIKLLPFAVFGAIGNLVMTINLKGAGPILVWLGETYLCLILMFVLYYVLLLIFTHTNPILFFRHYSRVILTTLSTASSSGSMPIALSCCQKMGVSPRIYSFSIPLGTTINMHGLMIVLATATAFLAKLYGIPMDLQFFTVFTLTAILICMAAPGVPGAGQAIMLIVLNQMGIPESGFLLIVGLIPLLDNMITCINVTGDGCVTMLLAKNEGLLDKEKYLNR